MMPSSSGDDRSAAPNQASCWATSAADSGMPYTSTTTSSSCTWASSLLPSCRVAVRYLIVSEEPTASIVMLTIAVF